MRNSYLLAICLSIAACGCHRDLTEYSLDDKTFDAVAMTKVRKESGLNIPRGATGLAFHHKPPIDPIVFAKIKIPAQTQDALANQIAGLIFSGASFPKDFANNRCKWWPSAPAGAILSKQAFNNGYYLELHLVKEKDDIILYLKYFTI